MRIYLLGTLIILTLGSFSCFGAERRMDGAQHGDWMLLVSPLAGWHENTLTSFVPGPRGVMKVSSTDSAPEYNLFSLFVHPRLVVNNTYFYSSDPNDADITGDFLYVNLYGAPEKKVRWNVGAGYLWHEISLDTMDIVIDMPMAKLGFVVRDVLKGLDLNPYIGYAWEGVETPHGDVDTESMLYGLTAKYYWRMLHVSLKYYLQDNLDTDEQYNVVKARVSLFMNTKFGFVARGEYSEHSQTKDSSLLFGPAFVF